MGHASDSKHGKGTSHPPLCGEGGPGAKREHEKTLRMSESIWEKGAGYGYGMEGKGEGCEVEYGLGSGKTSCPPVGAIAWGDGLDGSWPGSWDVHA